MEFTEGLGLRGFGFGVYSGFRVKGFWGLESTYFGFRVVRFRAWGLGAWGFSGRARRVRIWSLSRALSSVS